MPLKIFRKSMGSMPSPYKAFYNLESQNEYVNVLRLPKTEHDLFSLPIKVPALLPSDHKVLPFLLNFFGIYEQDYVESNRQSYEGMIFIENGIEVTYYNQMDPSSVKFPSQVNP